MKKNKIFLSVMGVAVLTGASRVLGFIREMLLAYFYGASGTSDAIVIALNIPLIVISSFGAAIANAYIICVDRDVKEAYRFRNSLILILTMITVAVSIVCSIFPLAVVNVFAAGFESERLEICTLLVRYTIWTICPIAAVQVIGAFLQTQGNFRTVNITDLLINCFLIFGIAASYKCGDFKLIGIFALTGYFMQLVVLFVNAGKYSRGIKPKFNFKSGDLKKFILTLAPLMLSVGLYEINTIVDKNYASMLPAGELSAINYASKIEGIVYTLLVSVSTVMFPYMAAKASDKAALEEMYRGGMAGLLRLALPISLFVFCFSDSIVSLLFFHGEFNAENLNATSQALTIYALEITAICVQPLITKTFYALKDVKRPLVCSAISIVVNIGLDYLLIGIWGLRGLAIATVISNFAMLAVSRMLLAASHGIKVKVHLSDIQNLREAICCFFIILEKYIFEKLMENAEIKRYESLVFCAFAVVYALVFIAAFCIKNPQLRKEKHGGIKHDN